MLKGAAMSQSHDELVQRVGLRPRERMGIVFGFGWEASRVRGGKGQGAARLSSEKKVSNPKFPVPVTLLCITKQASCSSTLKAHKHNFSSSPQLSAVGIRFATGGRQSMSRCLLIIGDCRLVSLSSLASRTERHAIQYAEVEAVIDY